MHSEGMEGSEVLSDLPRRSPVMEPLDPEGGSV